MRRISVGAAMMLSLLIRCLPWHNFVNPDGGFYFYSIDSYDHLRRITLGVQRFPSLADFDYYAAFPLGLGQLWAPGFDYVLSALCSLAGGGREVIETICFFFNPAVAALTVLLVFFIARAVFRSQAAGIFAALLLALHPAYVAYSLPMNFDHHSVEPLLTLLLFSLPLLERRDRLPLVSLFVSIAALLLAIVLWRGSTLYWGFAFVSIMSRVVLGRNRPLALSYGLVFGVAALILAIYCALDPWGGAREFSFGVISLFHVCLLTVCASILLLFRLCRTRRVFLWWLAGGAVLVLVAILAGPLAGMVKQIVGGFSFVRGQGDPWLESNSELRGVFKNRYSFWFSASYLTVFWWLSPVAVWLGFRQWCKGGKRDFLLLNFMLWSPLLAMGFVIRYSHIAGLFTSLTGAFLAVKLWERWEERRLQWLVIAGFFLLLLPAAPHLREAMSADLPGHMKYGLYGRQGVLEWLKQKTPPTSHWLNPVQKPEYGVLARWSMGAQIYQIAQRPALSTAFGWEAYGFFQEAAFWATEDESKALAIIQEARVRYVVAQAAHDLKTDFEEALFGQGRGDLPPNFAAPVFRPERTMQVRLMRGDGSIMKDGSVIVPALGSFRLIYESSYLASKAGGGSADLSYYKVFEVVRGAELRGRVERGVPVTLMLELQTSRQRKMTYLSQALADENGLFSVRLPYATIGQQGDTLPLGDYAIFVGQERKGTIAVSEADVVNGQRISL
ncbi:MAG: STT3 domain-containing protein [Desulfobulbaceae bacterium]|nr:STT3 domain-containing protein [Desulfobulbaceae bacterium]